MERVLGGIGLRTQIGLVGLLGTAIMIAVAALIFASMRHQARQQRIMDRAVAVNDLVSAIDVGLLQARRHEKDFLLRNDDESVDRQRRAIGAVNGAIERLAAVLSKPGDRALARSLTAGVAEYARRFDEVAALRTRLGLTEDSGLTGRMRVAVHAIEDRVRDDAAPPLEILMLTLRRHEKDFFARKDGKDADDFGKTAERFAAVLAGAAIPDSARADLRARLEEYRRAFLGFVEGTRAVADASKRMSDGYSGLQPILDQLIKETTEEYDASRTENAAARADMIRFVMAVLGAGVTLLVVSALAISGAVYRPLIGLTALMKRLATGDLTVTVPHQEYRNEIGEMARAVQVFKDDAIDKARMDAAERRRQEAERKAAEAQRMFIATMSHEFRTPLTIISGHAQQLAAKADSAAPGDIREHSGKVRAAVKRIQRLIDGILLSEKVEVSQIHFEPAPVDLSALIERCCVRHRDIAPDRGFILKLDGLPPVIECDETLADHLLDNILANAVKYSSPSDLIEIEGRREEGRAVIIVRDAGEGIAPEELPFIFGRYYRGRNARRLAGFGIGLHLANSIAILHGGSITVTSALGAGSTFTIRLPISRPSSGPETSQP